MPDVIKSYSVCFLFTADGSEVLLELKSKTGFAGRLNGVGGKIKPGETPFEGALREIQEETGLVSIQNFTWIGTLSLPWNCEKPEIPDNGLDDPACVLHYFAGIIPEGQIPRTPDGSDEPIRLYNMGNIVNRSIHDKTLAGNGDLQYFINQGYCRLFRHS